MTLRVSIAVAIVLAAGGLAVSGLAVSGLAVSGLAVADDKTPAAADDDTVRVQTSRATVTEFMISLKQQLRRALQMGGPSNAIQVCTVGAPAIAADLSARTGARVGRTSLKPRNPDNAPDDWERATLQAFEQRRQAGEDPRGIEAWATVAGADGPVFRYMKAIPMGGNCLPCHGQVVDRSVADTLAALYPNDTATGYNVGDVRGAFTIVQPK
jgi:Protein of unknown function (DUF3365)